MSAKRLMIILGLTSLIITLMFFSTYQVSQSSKLFIITEDDHDHEHHDKSSETVDKYVFDAEELNTTQSMKIDKSYYCGEDMGASFSLLVIVTSAVCNLDARLAIRETWGRYAIQMGARVLFLIGNTADLSVQKKFLDEEEKYGDLIQGQFIDAYFNLTLKTMSMMKWVSDRCSKVKYVLKVDDDMFVNMGRVIEFTQTKSLNKTIIGRLAEKWGPHRNKKSKWYVPYEVFKEKLYPNFVSGPAYILSGDSAQPLYEWSLKLRAFYLEDVYMTGIVAERAGIKRVHEKLMKNDHVNNINACEFSELMTSHMHTPKDIRRLWDKVVYLPENPCGHSTSPRSKSG